jgi:hypothetical protein
MARRFNSHENAYVLRDTLRAMLGCEPVTFDDLVHSAQT